MLREDRLACGHGDMSACGRSYHVLEAHKYAGTSKIDRISGTGRCAGNPDFPIPHVSKVSVYPVS